MKPNLNGVIVALWTPTDSAGRLLKPALRDHLQFLRERGVSALMPLGSTGEFVHLDLAARRELLAAVAELAPDMRRVANMSDISPRVVAELGRAARELGYAAVSILPPWYFHLEQADLLEFFLRAADAAQLPVALYNFPERTGHRLELETIAAFADRAPMAAIKQSGAEWDYHKALVALGREKGFVVLSGNDARLGDALALGCTGCVSGCANFVPETMHSFYQAAVGGDQAPVQSAAGRMRELIQLLGRVNFPLDVAAGMKARGLETGVPKQAVSAETQARFDALTADLRQLFARWQPA